MSVTAVQAPVIEVPVEGNYKFFGLPSSRHRKPRDITEYGKGTVTIRSVTGEQDPVALEVIDHLGLRHHEHGKYRHFDGHLYRAETVRERAEGPVTLWGRELYATVPMPATSTHLTPPGVRLPQRPWG